MLNAAAISEIRAALDEARHGHKGRVAKALAERYGVSVSTIYSRAERRGAKRPRAGNADYEAWTREAEALRHQAGPPVALDLAIEAAVAAGRVPPAAADMPIATAHRAARRLGLRPKARRTQRLHADYPMQALQFDGSTSQHLTVADELGDGDWLLKFHHAPTPAGGYKNKPLAEHRQRLIVYGVWDMCTGLTRSVARVARGEAAADSAAALVEILSEAGDPAMPLHGIPDHLWTDQGALFKASNSRDLLERLGIALVVGAAYQKTRMGGVERAWRTQWSRFERALFLTGEKTITLSAYAGRLAEYHRRQNASRPARVQVGGRTVSRTEAFAALVRTRPAPLMAMPPDALATLHREGRRRINRNGLISWEGAEFEAPWHDCWVTVRQGLADPDLLIIEDADGNRAEARPYRPRKYGEVRGQPATALDKLIESRAGDAPAGVDLYAPSVADARGNVLPLRAAPSPSADLDNPLDVSRFASVEDALAAFGAVYPYPLSPDDRAAVEAYLADADLSRSAVTELAGRLLDQLNNTNTLEGA